MGSWEVTEPRRLDLDGDVTGLDVALVPGRLTSRPVDPDFAA